MSRPAPRPAPEERLRAFLLSEAEAAMSMTDTEAELERFRDSIGAPSKSRRPAWLAAAAAAAVLATGATVVVLDGDDAAQTAPTATAVAPADAAPLPPSRVQAELEMSGTAGDAAYPAAGALWRVADERRVDRIDPASGQVTSVDVPVEPYEPFVEADGLVWFAGSGGSGTGLYALDPATNLVVRQNDSLPGARTVGVGPAGLWVVTGKNELTEIDPATAAVVRTIETEQGVYDLQVGEDAVYSGAVASGTGVTVVDTSTGSVQTVLEDVAPGPIALTADGDLWLYDAARAALARYDGETFAEQAVIELGGRTSLGIRREFVWNDEGQRFRDAEGYGADDTAYPVVADGALYAAYNRNGTARLLRADAATGDVRDVVQLGTGAATGPVTAADGSLWIGWRGADVVRRLALG